MVEKDWGDDLYTRLPQIQDVLRARFAEAAAAKLPAEQVALLMKLHFTTALVLNLGNDDLVGVQRCRPKPAGVVFGPDLPIEGGGGSYWVNFVLQN